MCIRDRALLGLTDKERAQILSINMANNPSRLYKEVWIGTAEGFMFTGDRERVSLSSEVIYEEEDVRDVYKRQVYPHTGLHFLDMPVEQLEQCHLGIFAALKHFFYIRCIKIIFQMCIRDRNQANGDTVAIMLPYAQY